MFVSKNFADIANLSNHYKYILAKIVQQTPEFERNKERDFVLKTTTNKLKRYGFNEIKRPGKTYQLLLNYIRIHYELRPQCEEIISKKNLTARQFYSALGYAHPQRLIAAHPARLEAFICTMKIAS